MPKFTVSLSLVGDDSDAVFTRIQAWDLTDDEGVLSVIELPEPIPVPPEMQPPGPQPTPPTPSSRHLDSVEPNEGPVAGGTEVTLTGVGFTNIGGVRFEGSNQTGWAWSFEVVDDNTITCPTPPMPAGVVTVVAFDGDPGDAVLENGFTYTAPSSP